MAWSLLQGAHSDLDVASALFRDHQDDEGYVRITAYHLQQSTEKALKYLCECRGVRYPKTHQLMLLLSLLSEEDQGKLSILLPYASVLTEWEATTRYGGESFAAYKLVATCIPIVRQVLQTVDDLTKGAREPDVHNELNPMTLE